MAYDIARVMYKRLRRACDVGDKNSLGNNGATQVVVTVGVEKCDGENKVIGELKIILSLYV